MVFIQIYYKKRQLSNESCLFYMEKIDYSNTRVDVAEAPSAATTFTK
jgi:hypothetical protein